MLARPSALAGLRRHLHPTSPAPHRPFQVHDKPATPDIRFCFVCGLASLPNSCRSPRSRSPSTRRHPNDVAIARRTCFAKHRSHPDACHAPLSWFLPTSAVWGLAAPPGMLQPDLGSEVHSVSVVPTDTTVSRVHPALRLPDTHAALFPGRQGLAGTPTGLPAAFRTLRRLAPRRQQHRLTTLLASLPFTVRVPPGWSSMLLRRHT